jgi:aryl-alcohol dehydrogenase-like predicted oxidoreductase
MKTRRLPGTDLDLSVVGFGCWAIGKTWWGDDVDDATSIAAVRRALDLGVNWFDTAPIYGWGHADETLVAGLGERKRDVVIATKVGVMRGPDGHAHSLLTPDNVRADLEASLARLGVETIDLLQVHWACESGTPLEVTFAALDVLRREGKFRYLGVCNYDAATLERIAAITRIVSLQMGYSLVRREFEKHERRTCAQLGIGMLAYEPLCRGLLTGKYTRVPSFPATDLRARDERFQGLRFLHGQRLAADLAKVAAKVGVPTSAVAIGWVASRPGVTAAIAGAKRPEQVEQNVRAAAIVDRANVWEIVDRIAERHGGTHRASSG